MNCPGCDSPQQQQRPEDGKRTWWACQSYGVGKLDWQSELCEERSLRIKAERERDDALRQLAQMHAQVGMVQ